MCDFKIILWTFLFGFVFIIESECKKTKFTAGHMEKLNLCSLDIDEGDCGTYDSISSEDEDNSTVSYGYNNETMKCEEFIYEGCGGNDNRFDSMHECWRMCYTPLKYFLARATDYLVYRYTNLSNETTSAQKSEQEDR